MKRLSRRKVQEKVSKNVDIAGVTNFKGEYIVEFYYQNFYRNIRATDEEAIPEKITETVMKLGGA